MDISKIALIVNSIQLDSSAKEELIIQVIAEDPKAIPLIMKMLAQERSSNKELILDMNLELSRAHLHIKHPTLASGGKSKKEEVQLMQAREFVLDKITEFYVKYRGKIRNCFNMNFDK